MNKEEVARGGEGIINKPGGRFELIWIDRYARDALSATIRDIRKERKIHVEAYFNGNTWRVKNGIGEYSAEEIGVIEKVVQDGMNNEAIIACSKIGLEFMEGDFIWNEFLLKKREDADSLKSTVIAKIVNTGINRYIEFEKHLQGFQDGEILTYRRCEDGTSVIIKREVLNDPPRRRYL